MGKNKQELVENKAKNPIYSEILYRINEEEVYILQLKKHYKKSYPILYKQVKALEKDGFLTRRTEGRKEMFRINWEKITGEFVSYVVKRAKQRYKELSLIEEIEKAYKKQEGFYLPSKYGSCIKDKDILQKEKVWKLEKDERKATLRVLITDKRFRKDVISNNYLKRLFIFIFQVYDDYNYYNQTLEETFSQLMQDLVSSKGIIGKTKRDIETYVLFIRVIMICEGSLLINEAINRNEQTNRGKFLGKIVIKDLEDLQNLAQGYNNQLAKKSKDIKTKAKVRNRAKE